LIKYYESGIVVEVGRLCEERYTAKIFKLGISHNSFDQPLPQAFASVFWEDKDIADVTESCQIAQNSGKADLTRRTIIREINPIANSRICNRDFHYFPSPALSPVRFFRNEPVDDIEIEG